MIKRNTQLLLLWLALISFINVNAQSPVGLGSGSFADSPPSSVWDEGAYYGKTYRELSDGWPWHIHPNKQSAPIPTNDWWTATIFDQYTGNLEVWPQRVEGTANGIKVSLPQSFAMFDSRGLSVIYGASITVKGSVDLNQSGDTEIFADFESSNYPAGWSVSANPPYPGPVSLADFTQSPTPQGFLGDRFINTYKGDGPQMTLTSPNFTITKNYIHFLLGGGNNVDLNYLGLYINGNRVLAETGENSANLKWKRFDVSAYIGQAAQIRIVDASSGGWGFTLCDNIVFSNSPDVSSSFSNSFWPQDAKAYDWSDLGFVFRLEDDQSHYMDGSVYHGVPYTYIDLNEVDPIIETSSDATDEYTGTGAAVSSFPYNGNTLVVAVEGKLFGIHAPNGTVFEKSPAGNYVPVIPAGAPKYVVISAIPSQSLISTYDNFSRNKITASTFNWNYDQAGGNITTTFQFNTANYETGSQSGETLLALQPHHYRNTSGYSLIGGADYETMYGTMHTTQGKNFNLTYQFGGMPPYLPKPLDLNGTQQQRLNDLLSAKINVSEDYNGNTYAKGFGEESNIMLMAKELQHPGYETIKNNIKQELINWLTFTTSESGAGRYFFAEYPQFGALIGFPVGFGSQAFNDLHFHYGYFITGAARLMMVDEDFKNQYGDMVIKVAKSYANWKRYGVNDTDRQPFLRNFDPYAGHSWAGGIGSGVDGNNQESTSEAMHSWFGIYLLGIALEDDEILSLGATGFMLEGITTQDYWFDRNGDMPDEYAFDYVGILKANNMAMATFFDGDPAWAFGIQAVPADFFYSYYLGREPAKAASDWSAMVQDRVEFGEIGTTDPYANIVEMGPYLGGYHLNYIQSYDPAFVASTYDQLITQEGGDWATHVNSATNYYISNASLTYGLPAEGYHTSLATGGVFQDANGELSVLVYNYTSSSKNVNIYQNGAVIETVTVGPKQYYNSKIGNNPAPVVNAGPDQTVTLPTNTVTLNGSATDNGSITSYNWTKVSGPAANIASPSSATTQVTGLVAGTYVFRLSATDNDANSAYDDVTITMQSQPQGCDGITLSGASASSQEGAFTAANAIDGDQGTRWSSEFSIPQWLKVDLGSRNDVSEVSIIWERASAESYYIMVSDVNSTPDPNSADWNIISTQTGMADAARTDNIAGLSGCGRYVAMYATNKLHPYGISIFEFDVCGTTCGTSQNNAPSANFTVSTNSGNAPLTVSFDGSSSSDPDNDPLTYNWNFGDGSTASGQTVSHTYSGAGSYNATLTVSDGQLSDNEVQVITVQSGNNSGAPIGATIWLRGSNNLYVSSENGGAPMMCDRGGVAGWEQFTVVDAGGGLVALRGSNGQYVTATSPMYCNATSMSANTRFAWVSQGSSSVALRGSNNLYVSSENGGAAMNCNRGAIGGWEVFSWGTVTGAAARTAGDQMTDDKVMIYPNPVTSTLHVFHPEMQVGDVLEVISMDGKKVISQSAEGAKQTLINVQSLQPGLYLLQIIGREGVYKFQKQ
ncbi:glycosyl hydrolase [Fulvivirga ligni]|uniref:glycosyl hydrolase n=1 Tax=Fulvivirga ligni TaxID=2904246 RepID=UPI001EEAC089|nr:glycosyl hydrolase [Fulvivirga ligni]UII19964.1 PKD domain-containing protein [Fulvivirga ligni]